MIYRNADTGGGDGGGVATAPAPAPVTTPATPSTNAPSVSVTEPPKIGGFFDYINDESLRKDPALAPLVGKGVDDAARMLVNQAKLVGKKTLEMPNEKWDDAKWNELYNALGRPEKPDAYELAKPEQLPEGVNWNDDTANAFKQKAHELGFTPKQVKALSEWHMQTLTQQAQAFQQAQQATFEQGVESLRKEWGQEFDAKVNDARIAVRALGGDELVQALEQTGLGNHPAIVKAMAKAGTVFREDVASGKNSHSSFALSKDHASMKIAELRADKEFMEAYNNTNHVGYKKAQETLSELYRQKAGT